MLGRLRGPFPAGRWCAGEGGCCRAEAGPSGAGRAGDLAGVCRGKRRGRRAAAGRGVVHLEKLWMSQGAVCACEARSWAESCGVLRGVFCGAAVASHSGACCLAECVVRAELCSECGWEFACARVCGPASRCVCVLGGAPLGVEGERGPLPPPPPAPFSPFTERGFQDPPGPLPLQSPWLRGGGRRQSGPAPAPGAPANPPPALSLPSAGWAPSPAAPGSRAGKMVANEEGEWRELEPGPPLPHFLLGLHTRLWKELGDGSWAHAGGRALLAAESQGPLCSELGVRAEGTLAPAPSPFSPPGEIWELLGEESSPHLQELAGQSYLCSSAPCWHDPVPCWDCFAQPKSRGLATGPSGAWVPVRTFCRLQEQTLPRKAGERLSCFLRGWEGAGGEAQRKSSQLGVCPPFLRLPAVEGGGYLLEAFPVRCTGELPHSP